MRIALATASAAARLPAQAPMPHVPPAHGAAARLPPWPGAPCPRRTASSPHAPACAFALFRARPCGAERARRNAAAPWPRSPSRMAGEPVSAIPRSPIVHASVAARSGPLGAPSLQPCRRRACQSCGRVLKPRELFQRARAQMPGRSPGKPRRRWGSRAQAASFRATGLQEGGGAGSSSQQHREGCAELLGGAGVNAMAACLMGGSNTQGMCVPRRRCTNDPRFRV